MRKYVPSTSKTGGGCIFFIIEGRLERNNPEWGCEDVDRARAQLGLGMFPSLRDVTCL